MPVTRDDQFANRADAHIRLSNQQAQLFLPQPTTEAMIFGTARFTAWYIASTAKTRQELQDKSVAEMDRFTQIFRELLEENMQDHINRFDDEAKEVR